MNKLLLAATLLAGGVLFVPTQTYAHGGRYSGPGDTVPSPPGGAGGGGGGGGPATGPAGPTTPGPAGPVTPGTGAPGTPGGSLGRPSTGTGTDGGPDLTEWVFWWERNKEPYLNLKSNVHREATETGTDGVFLGHGKEYKGKGTLKPSDAQIRQQVVPALLAALAEETNNDIITGCLIALAKIGDAPSETEDSEFEKVIARFLSDKNQEISETAAVALGILANAKSIDTLCELLSDSPKGRALVGQPEVNYRTRAFAAYGLGLIGKIAAREEDRMRIISNLRRAIETDSTRTRDLKVSCVIAMGLVALDTIDSTNQPEAKGALVRPETSRSAQLDYLLDFLKDDKQDYVVRAHCPTALARLLSGLPPEQYQSYRTKISEELLARIDPRSNEKVYVVQSAVQALGLIGTNDDASPLDRRIREGLVSLPKDQSARNFAMISLAKIGGRTATGAQDAEGGIGEITKALLERLADGKGNTKAWAALSCGVMANELAKTNGYASRVSVLQGAVRAAMDDDGKDPSKLGAFAIAAGIMGDMQARAKLTRRLDTEKDAAALGYVAVGLGLMNDREAIAKISEVIDASKYKADLLKQAAIALGLLGDKEVVPRLIGFLKESKSLAAQAALSMALGFIGDKRSIDPLVEMLQNQSVTAGARGFAAAALGIVADKEPLPWNCKIALDLNYLAATPTLTQPSGTGILDIL